MKKAKDKPIDPKAIHMVFGKHSNEKESNNDTTKASGWIGAWEKRRTEYEEVVPARKGNLIRAKKVMGSSVDVINPGDVVMFLHFEELVLITDIKFDIRLDAESLWDKEKGKLKMSDEELEGLSKTIEDMNKPRKIMSYHVHVLANEKTQSLSIESPEKFSEYFEVVDTK